MICAATLGRIRSGAGRAEIIGAGSGLLYGETDSDAEFAIKLEGTTALSAEDFIF